MAFPLSTTHYIETSKITSRRQRLDLAWTIAPSPIAVPCAHLRSCRAIRRCASSSSCCATRAAAYYGDILLPANFDRVAVPPGRDAPAALTSRHRVDAISTPVILPAGQACPSGRDGYEFFTVNVVRLTGLLRV